MQGGVGSILYSDRGGTTKMFHYNARGDVTTQTDSSGATVDYQAVYTADGEQLETDGTNNDPQQANTKEEGPDGLLNEHFRVRDLKSDQ